MEFVILSSMNINYVLHIVLRSSKFFGVLFFNFISKSKENKISVNELVLGFFFTVGVAVFSFTGSKKNEQSTSLFGLFCALAAFFLDGAVSYYQGKTRNVNMPSVSSFCFMQMTNFWCLIASVVFSLMKNSFHEGFRLLLTNPDVLLIMLTLACVSVVGQFFTFDHINRFGSISLSLVNTVRKILSIILSVLIYRHPMNLARYCGLGIIFLVLISNTFGKQIILWLNKKVNPPPKTKAQ